MMRISRHPFAALPLFTLALFVSAACSEKVTVEQTILVEQDTPEDAQPPARNDAFSRVVAGISEKGSGAAESAWAEQRPTLLLFAASW